MTLPPEPQRQEQTAPETIRDYALLVIYYEELVEEWEAWADCVKQQVNKGESNP